MKISNSVIYKYAKDAKEAVAVYGFKFEGYDVLKDLDAIANILHSEYNLNKANYGEDFELLINSMAIKNAAIIVELVKFKLGNDYCKWENDHPIFKENTYPLYVKGSVLFPKQWFLDAIVKNKKYHIEKMINKYLPELVQKLN